MGRNPDKTEQLVVWCDDRTKRRWAAWAATFDDAQEALNALLDLKDDNPRIVKNYE